MSTQTLLINWGAHICLDETARMRVQVKINLRDREVLVASPGAGRSEDEGGEEGGGRREEGASRSHHKSCLQVAWQGADWSRGDQCQEG